MNRKWLSVLVGPLLFLPQLTCGAELSIMEKTEAAIFKPVSEEQEQGALFGEQKGTAGDVFGPRRGYVHPFLSVGGYFTSNIFNTEDNERSDTVLVVSPGIWLALPASRQQLLQVETLNTAPGGLEVSRFETEAERRFQGYALYRGEFTENNNFEEAETEDHRAEALLLYNAPGGLTVELVDIFENDHDPFATGDAGVGELRTFKSNLLTPLISYKVSPKLRLQVDYTWYVLDYDASRDVSRDREDHVFSGYVFFKFAPKTSAFLDYEYAAVVYDENIKTDNHENRIFGGLQWNVTEKSRGRIKLGYGKREFEGSDEDRKFLAAEIQLDHRFTRKTSIYLRASRKAGESDIEGARDVLRERVRVGYTHLLTAKLTGKASAFFYRDEYDGEITVGTQTDERTDKRYGGEIALGYALTRWLNVSGGYVYAERDSNFDDRDYRNHTVFLNVTTAL